MNPDVLPYLRCPVCGCPLDAVDACHPGAGTAKALRCPRGHSFDVARQGYVNLTTGRTTHAGDSAEMVRSRADFLSAGHYDFITIALQQAARRETARRQPRGTYPDLVVDAGAGTGWHLAGVLDALPTTVGLALDVSKPALRRAARAHPRSAAALCDTWGPLPLRDGSAAALLNVFAPRNGAEFHRVLDRDGALLVVTPAADHLRELVDRLDLLRVDPAKTDRLAASLVGHFDLAGQSSHRHRPELSRREVHTLVGMGPSAWHADPIRIAERIADLPEPVPVTASIRLAVYHPR